MVEGPLPPDWKLDDDDLKPPAFAPGSVRDEDWRERDIEAAKVRALSTHLHEPLLSHSYLAPT